MKTLAGKNKPAAARIRPARRPAATTTPREATDLSRELPPSAPPVPAENPADWEEALDDARKALGDTANLVRALWISFIFFGLYLTVAAGGITHRQLFLETPISLPIVGASLPLVAFFWIAPFLFVVGHAYMLLHLTLMAERAQRYVQLADAGNMSPEIRARSDGQLPSHVFIEFLTAEQDGKRRAVGRVVRFITWFTMVIAPVALLLLIQISFLPYQDQPTTWVHRLLLLADLALIVVYWPKVSREVRSGPTVRRRRMRVLAAGSLGAVVFSWLVATFPGERHDENLISRGLEVVLPQWVGHCVSVGPCKPRTFREFLFSENINEPTGSYQGLFPRTIILTSENLVDLSVVASNDNDIGNTRPWQRQRSLSQTRARSFVGANFNKSDLRYVDFRAAKLNGAKFDGANLQGASFDWAQLQITSFSFTLLQGSSFNQSQMQGAWMVGAQLHGASLDRAEMQGAVLAGATAHGASLNSAVLHGAALSNADFRGASLIAAQLQGAILEGSDFAAATMFAAQIQGATAVSTNFDSATMNDTYVWRLRGQNFSDFSNVLSNNFISSRSHFELGGESSFDDRDYDLMISNTNSDIDSKYVRDIVLKRLYILDPDINYPETSILFWTEIEDNFNHNEYNSALANVVCDSTSTEYVLYGIYERYSPVDLSLFKKIVSDNVSNRACAGAKNASSKRVLFLPPDLSQDRG